MRKYLKFIFLFLMVSILNIKDVNAYSVSNINREECSNFELVRVSSSTITHVECFDSYYDAYGAMNNLDNEDGIPSVIYKNEFIDSKYALVNLRTKSSASFNTYMYPDASTYSDSSYVNGYYAPDAAYVSLYYTVDDKYTRAKIQLSGLKQFVPKREDGQTSYEIVPLTIVKSPNKYIVSNGSLVHYIAYEIGQDNSYASSFSLGPSPSYLNTNTNYYSYDGNYFYTSLYDLVDDLKEDSHNRAVNKDEPYYNYYQYLPQRTKTNITSTELDSYLRQQGKTITNSKLYGQGHYFITSQNIYGINALVSYAISLNESAKGSSSIAMNKNNVFGHAAYDYDPTGSSTAYSSVMYSIYYHADVYMSRGYSYTGDWRYYGSYLGNKLSGVNVKYASDPYWGEKASSYYYIIDKKYNLKDYDYYTIGMKTTTSAVNVRSAPSTSSSVVYTIPGNKYPTYVIVGEVNGDEYQGSDIWYKVLFDSALDGTTPTKTGLYGFNQYVYIHSKTLEKINNPSSYKNPNDVKTKDTGISYKSAESEEYYEITKDTNMYYDSLLTANTYITVPSGTKVLLKETAYNSKSDVAYLVAYGSNTEWISASSLKYDNEYNKLIASIKYKNLDKPILLKVKDNLTIYSDGILVNKTSLTQKKDTYVVATKIAYTDEKDYSYYITYDATSAAAGYIDASKVEVSTTYKIGNNNDNNLLNIRSEANTWSSRVGSTNEQYTNFVVLDSVTGENIEGNDVWYKIIYYTPNNSIGYINSKYASIVVDSKKEDNSSSQTDNKQTTDNNDKKGDETPKEDNNTTQDNQEAKQDDTKEDIKEEVKEEIKYTKTTGLFEFTSLTFDEKTNKFNLIATLKVDGVELSKDYNVKYDLILKPLNNSSSNQVVALNEHSYSNININATFDLSSISQGDYALYVRARVKDKEVETLLNNVFGRKTLRKLTVNNRGYLFRTNYYSNYVPIELSIRDQGNITNTNNPTNDNMFNDYVNIELKNDKLSIKGTSYNVNGDYGSNQKITRQIILENTTTYKRTTYDVGYIDNGNYEVILRVPDNKSKIRAWFDASLDLSKLEKGTYIIYIRTQASSIDDYGELTDIFARDLSNKTIKLSNGLTAKLKLNKDVRMRVELVIE